MNVDMHVHSSFSKRPSVWLLQKLGCRESYTPPHEIYRIAKSKGMDAVTITDHNSIEGCLAITDLPDVFISAEVTTYFPADNCKLHVLVYGITEKQFAEIDRLRSNVFELVGYLQRENIVHALAHPFYSVNDRLTPAHFEQCLLLFNRFELNNDQDSGSNCLLLMLLTQLGQEDIARLQEIHGIDPGFAEPWVKGLVAGSDDHSSLNIAGSFTTLSGADTVDEFLEGVAEHRARPVVARPGSPLTRAHGFYGVTYQFYTDKFNLAGHHDHDVLMRFLDRMLQTQPRNQPNWLNRLYFQWRRRNASPPPPQAHSLTKLLQHEAQKLILRDPKLAAVLDETSTADSRPVEQWYSFVNRVSNTMLAHLSRRAVERLSKANIFDLFNTAGSAGALYSLLAPYFISFAMYRKCRAFGEDVRRQLGFGRSTASEPRVAHFTDTLQEVNGVAKTLSMQTVVARRTGKHLRMLTCATDKDKAQEQNGVRFFEPVDVYQTPEYPEQKLFIPPFLEMLQFCYEDQATHIHGATPGPVGLAALAIARILRLPFYTTYHTAVPQYARFLTDDENMEHLVWRFVLWFYEQADVVFVPSRATGAELIERGIPESKIRIMPRGIDTKRFRPVARSKGESYPSDEVRFIYVGRVSKEKNLPLLCRAFKKMHKNHLCSHLVVVGDGPYLEEMRETMDGTPCTFTGYLDGDDLVQAYSDADVFVFPSTTDTFGNVVVEAQACGLPVIVSDQGGPCENLIHGESGLVVTGGDVDALAAAMTTLLLSPSLRQSMGESARLYGATRSFNQAFEEYWENYIEGEARSAARELRPMAPVVDEAVVA